MFLIKTRWLQQVRSISHRRWLTQCCTELKDSELSDDMKHKIEKHWSSNLSGANFNKNGVGKTFYVLSMFPYPSGNLHLGHVRVYTISDAVARFQRMCGINVFHPMGWDSFGLPAENAAIERGVAPKVWTEQNIQQMKKQFEDLGCSFDWKYELSTCDPAYYKWTQKLFLMLHREGLAYQNEALVNWDPIDRTVLADEQVDENGCSWRSGANVEKKLLKQWFIKTTAFAEQLYEGLDDPTLKDWRDIVNIQRHWIGDCDGYGFQLLTSCANSLRIWTQNPEYLKDPNAFVVLKTDHYLGEVRGKTLDITIENPFTGTIMPVIFSDLPEFAEKCNVYLAAPSFNEEDKEIQEVLGLSFFADDEFNADEQNIELLKKEVLQAAQRLKIGGYKVSSKLQDWLISRQRHWGTPIPIINCEKCGVVPVPDEQLPVLLPNKLSDEKNREDSLKCCCPKCNNPNAIRESDTMDTFVDSSWYYLRFMDPQNTKEIFNKDIVANSVPVDLYIGGKEHAVLHLYYARFMNHFLHSQGLVPSTEPFSRLLVQGMVKGRSYRVKGSGRYVKEHEIDVINDKKNQAVLKESKEPVTMMWEKMSKSKMNGIDPGDMFKEYGVDTTRLIILADVSPRSDRLWSNATFPGILNWQKRLWTTVNEFCELRSSSDNSQVDINSTEFLAEDEKLFDARNFYVNGVTFHYRHSHKLSVAISRMQALSNCIRKAPKNVVRFGKQYERALAVQLVMLAPMAPHFASELWSKFASAPNRVNTTLPELQWHEDVLAQKWPEVDQNYRVNLVIKVNGIENCCIKIPQSHIDKVTHNDALDIAFNTDSVTSYLIHKKIRTTNFVLYPGLEAVLNISTGKAIKEKKTNENSNDDEEIVH